jgi:cyclopropane fatty-acyl-phospholipid synthase-like methyltransferase
MTCLSEDQRHHEQLSSVIRYYDGTWFDYRWMWLNSENNAIHFGYHDGQRRSHADSLLNTNQVLADIADIGAGDRVLDAGCGIAGSSMWLARQRGATVVGITPVRTQVERARRLVAARRLAQSVTIEQADFTRTPFADASFDVVWALESVCHAPAKAAFYRESARLLRPGGRLIVAEYMRASRPLAADDETLLAQWLRGWMIPDLDTAPEHRRHALEAGFSDIELRDVTANMRPSLRRLYALSLAGVPTSRVLHRLRLRGPVPHGNVLGSMYQYRALRRGSWAYRLLYARKPSDRRDAAT